jgi:hypothetical protein
MAIRCNLSIVWGGVDFCVKLALSCGCCRWWDWEIRWEWQIKLDVAELMWDIVLLQLVLCHLWGDESMCLA